jgi:phosphomannomutase
MTLIKSISGIRGTVGGKPGENLTPPDVVSFVTSFSHLLSATTERPKIVVGRDGRTTGAALESLVVSTLILCGADVISIGLTTTPTIEMYITKQGASGGIMLSASHNPQEWNALKLFNHKGEFIDQAMGEQLLNLSSQGNFTYSKYDQIGTVKHSNNAIEHHIKSILQLPLVLVEPIKKKNFRVVVDCVNSTGALAFPPLFKELGCEFLLIHNEISGEFSHNPEPLEENLSELSLAVKDFKADLGIAVDPDVDRLAFMDENGHYCGEEFTLVMVANWVLDNTPGSTVSNLSSTMALRELTEKRGLKYSASAVGEVNVVEKMKSVKAVIGGEGNGGVIYPDLHYGRDAVVGVALMLSALAKNQAKMSDYRNQFPNYKIVKNKIPLTKDIDIDKLMIQVEDLYKSYNPDITDGVKIHFDHGWAHLRRSNTEPIIRLYTEGSNEKEAQELARSVKEKVTNLLGQSH